MKNKITKIIVFALVSLMLFGTFAASAYESYDTYTYSIDGEPLASPHAYTPDVLNYDSAAMNLLGGNFWHYDTSGDVVAWPQKEISVGIDFNSMIYYTLSDDGESYTVSAFATDEIEKIISILLGVDAVIAEYRTLYPNNTADNVEIDLAASEVVNDDGTYVSPDELVSAVRSTLEEKVLAASANEQNVGKNIALGTVDTASIRKMLYEIMGLSNIYVEIPAEYNLKPVTEIAENVFTASFAPTEDEAYNAMRNTVCTEIYKDVRGAFIGENIVKIGKGAFTGAENIKSVYYGGESLTEWGAIEVDKSAKYPIDLATVYCYSEFEKFGDTPLKGSSDVTTDHEGNVYIADKDNNRVVILNGRDYKVKGIISTYIDDYNRDRTLNGPGGVFVTNPELMVDGSSNIYICNTNDSTILVFDKDYNYVETIEQPPIAGLLEEGEFIPTAVAVDKYGRIFVVSKSCYKGIIVLSNEGKFTGFIGAQKVTTDFMDQIWKNFQSVDQKQSSVLQLPDPFNNLTVDDDGFVYATISFSEQSDLQQQFTTSKGSAASAAYSPVKKLNSMGVEIMKRNGFFDPGGEVLKNNVTATASDVSKITDVAVGDEGTWTILDTKRQRTFTYDKNGNLLFAFGNKGEQLGNTTSAAALAYQPVVVSEDEYGKDYKYNMILLDKTVTGTEQLVIYHPTEYCEMIMKALESENKHKYDQTIVHWQNVLTRNNNFDLAYIGIGKALYNQGDYDGAMKMLASAYETEQYSLAFAAVRKDILSVWMIPLIIGVIVLLLLFFKFLGWAKKKNKATSLKVGKKTFGEELVYVTHLIFHPFDGFWDLKHEKRGSVRAATTILGVTIVAFFYQAIGTGYMHNPKGDYSTVFMQIVAVLVPVILWVIGNWCLTTLFDGEGSLKDIYIATCYSLAPLPVFVILSTILTNVLTVSEGGIIGLLVGFGYVWVGILLFFGMAVTHDYTTGKNLIAVIGSVVAMAVIMFIVILFSSLVMKMALFLISLFTEVFDRIM